MHEEFLDIKTPCATCPRVIMQAEFYVGGVSPFSDKKGVGGTA